MDSRQIQLILLRKTYTRTDYIRRVNLIREYLEERFFKGNYQKFIDFLAQAQTTPSDREGIGYLDDSFFNLFTKDNFYVLTNRLMDDLKVLPVLTLYMPVVMEDKLIDELGSWFRKNLHSELIMEIHCNPMLVTGCAYVWNNRYQDISLHFLLGKKNEIINKIIDDHARQLI